MIKLIKVIIKISTGKVNILQMMMMILMQRNQIIKHQKIHNYPSQYNKNKTKVLFKKILMMIKIYYKIKTHKNS